MARNYSDPSYYRPEFLDLAARICMIGANHEQLAFVLGVVPRTIRNWKAAHPDFAQAVDDATAAATAKAIEARKAEKQAAKPPDGRSKPRPKGVRFGGRAKGSLNKKTLELQNAMKRRGGNPVDVVGRLSLIGRFGRPDEIANAALWLCSDDSSFVIGHPLAVDAGYLAR